MAALKGWCAGVLAFLAGLPGCGELHALPIEQPAWTAPFLASVPGADLLGGQALSTPPGRPAQLVVASAWSDYGFNAENPRIAAIDLATGDRLWHVGLEGPCAAKWETDRRELVASFDNGDVAVATMGFEAHQGSLLYRYTCYRRLSGVDGAELWTWVDRPASGEPQVSRIVHKLAVDEAGDLVAVGSYGDSVRLLKINGVNGEPRWIREVAEPAAPRAFDLTAGSGALAVQVSWTGGGVFGGEIVALDPDDGSIRWRRTSCVGVGDSVQVGGLRATQGGTLTFVEGCKTGESDFWSAGRVDAATGSLAWHRAAAGSYKESVSIDEAGHVYLAGSAFFGGPEQALLKLDASDGHSAWSVPGTLLDPDPYGGDWVVFLQTAVEDGYVHVWQLLTHRYNIGISTTRLLRFDAASGALQGRRDVVETGVDYFEKFPELTALPNGEVMLAADSRVDQWLWLARADAATGVHWWRRETLERERSVTLASNTTTLLQSNAGTPGLVLAGTVSAGSYLEGYPVVAKLASHDGRTLWRWRPETAPVRSHIADVAVDTRGNILAAGVGPDDSWESVPFLLKLDGSSGRVLWQKLWPDIYTDRLALDPSGEVFSVWSNQLRRNAGADGAEIWRVVVPDVRFDPGMLLAVDPAGNPIVAGKYSLGNGEPGESGLQVLKFRGTDGTRVWLRRWPDPELVPIHSLYSLAVLPGGDVVMSGMDRLNRALLVRLDASSGATRWQRQDTSGQVIVDRDGNIVLHTGDWRMARLDGASGATLWARDYGDFGGTQWIRQFALAPVGELLLAGSRSYSDLGVMRVALADGAVRWQGGVSTDVWSDAPRGIAPAGDGGVFVAAHYDEPGAEYLSALLKYDGPVAGRIFADGFD